jgi:hypothetical protein
MRCRRAGEVNMEKLTREDLYRYLLTVQEAARIQNADVDPKEISEEEWAVFCMREGASRLAQEIISRYGMAASEN